MSDAIGWASDLQDALTAEPWANDGVFRVRVGLHTGEADERGGDYFGPAVNIAARISAAGHGGRRYFRP